MEKYELLIKVLANQYVIYRELQKVKDLLKKRSAMRSELSYTKELDQEASGFMPYIQKL